MSSPRQTSDQLICHPLMQKYTHDIPKESIDRLHYLNPPSSIEDIRNISGTPFFSKQYESFLSDWLLPIVDPYLDPGQCGGLKKSSISHYLVKLLHFAHFNLDKQSAHAVLLGCVDMSKAFNRMSHQQVIEDLFHMKVPGWLLLILISYLTDRKMVMKFRGVLSALRLLPGSSPQGTVLGVILFIIYFNGAALRPEIPRPRWPFFSSRTNDPPAINMKFIDDISIAVNISLNNDLEDHERQQTLNYDERPGTLTYLSCPSTFSICFLLLLLAPTVSPFLPPLFLAVSGSLLNASFIFSWTNFSWCCCFFSLTISNLSIFFSISFPLLPALLPVGVVLHEKGFAETQELPTFSHIACSVNSFISLFLLQPFHFYINL